MSLAFVTGASRGIGKATAIALARAGYDVVVHYHTNEEAAQSVANEIVAMGRQAHLVCFDVGAAESTEAAVDAALTLHGCPDVLINNAGLVRDGLFPLMSRQAWDDVLRVNLGSFFSVTRPIVRKMIRQKKGRIVNISSVSGQSGNAGQVNYAASKAGLIGATKSLALELASRGITVNAVAPGMIATDMTEGLPLEKIVSHIPMGRLGTPEEVAAAVVFLCSEAASYITGEVLSVNGGLYT